MEKYNFTEKGLNENINIPANFNVETPTINSSSQGKPPKGTFIPMPAVPTQEALMVSVLTLMMV